MQALRTCLLGALCALPAAAVQRIGEPVSPSQWDAFLPESVHPSYASDLGALQEGRLGFGFSSGDLSHLSLSVPGLQIISANTKWNVDKGDERLAYDPKHAALARGADGEWPDRHRDLFLVAGGLRLSNFMPSLSRFDLGAGATFTHLSITDGDEKKIWSSAKLGGSLSLQYGLYSLAGSWDAEEQRYRLGYRSPQDLQMGLELYQNLEADKAYGTQAGAEKVFRESIKFRAGMRWQWAQVTEAGETKTQQERVENMMLLGTSVRFRPWRAGVDPEWLQPLVAPLGSVPWAQRFLYDWEAGLDWMLDNQWSSLSCVVSLSRWF